MKSSICFRIYETTLKLLIFNYFTTAKIIQLLDSETIIVLFY